MPIELITVKDLQLFKNEFFSELKRVLNLEKQESQDSSDLLRTKEVRKILKISAGTLQNLKRQEILTPLKIGGSLYYKREDIKRLFIKQVQ